MDISDEALVDGTRSGDAQAFNRLMQRYQGAVYHAAHRVVGNAHSAMDITQEVFIKAYRKLEGLKAGALVRPWLLRITYHEAISSMRGPVGRELPLNDDALKQGVNDAAEIGARVEREQLRAALIEAMSSLNPEHRTILMMRYFDDLKIREIAVATGLAEATIKSTLFRSLKRIRAQMPHTTDSLHEHL